MLTVGVLGASGFVGSRLVEKLHLEGRIGVVPIVRSFAGLARSSRFRLEGRIADALDRDALVKAFEGCDVVIHTVLGPLNQIVAEPPIVYGAAEAAGIRRLIHISTASVHGQDPEPGTDETSALRTDQPVPYNNAKVRAERQFRALHRNGRVELVVLRPGIVFGPRDIWVNGIAHKLASGTAYLVDGGRGICNTIYIDNLIHAIELSLTAPVDGEVFLVGDREPVTWAELYRWVAVALGDCPPAQILSDPPIIREERPLLDRLRGNKVLKRVFRQIPRPVKLLAHRQINLATGMLAGANQVRQLVDGAEWALPDDGPGAVPLETAMLHRCRYKFPFAKAERLLGYEPPIAVEEGLIRSIRALRFAGFSVNPAFADMLLRTRQMTRAAPEPAERGRSAPSAVTDPVPPGASPSPA